MPIIIFDGDVYEIDAPKPVSKLAMFTVGVLTLGASLLSYITGRKSRMRRETMLELFADQEGDPRDWFPNIFPPNIQKGMEGGRMWRHYPFRIGPNLYLAHSTSTRGVFVVGREHDISLIPWEDVRDVGIFLERV